MEEWDTRDKVDEMLNVTEINNVNGTDAGVFMESEVGAKFSQEVC